ncbi:hypothetical protein PMPD1_4380 (plasmid) [Paramixta manurensis]|uniref:Uncharacterized protein n=1 Tax=Paramixta manurensis TaxID=2740817 RepID=A0A6M8UEU7_9GAMM|nr:hypothetical protein PMPD1_4380 [Erwiniaceae bacterium PD-1]
MNEFHELNMLTLQGDINRAFSLISSKSEGIAKKIMQKAGYPVPEITGREFWLYVQNALTRAARARSCGYRFQRKGLQAPVSTARAVSAPRPVTERAREADRAGGHTMAVAPPVPSKAVNRSGPEITAQEGLSCAAVSRLLNGSQRVQMRQESPTDGRTPATAVKPFLHPRHVSVQPHSRRVDLPALFIKSRTGACPQMINASHAGDEGPDKADKPFASARLTPGAVYVPCTDRHRHQTKKIILLRQPAGTGPPQATGLADRLCADAQWFDGLVSFSYNVSNPSAVMEAADRGDMNAVYNKMLQYIYVFKHDAKGRKTGKPRILPPLYKRRLDEAAPFRQE